MDQYGNPCQVDRTTGESSTPSGSSSLKDIMVNNNSHTSNYTSTVTMPPANNVAVPAQHDQVVQLPGWRFGLLSLGYVSFLLVDYPHMFILLSIVPSIHVLSFRSPCRSVVLTSCGYVLLSFYRLVIPSFSHPLVDSGL